MRKSGSGLTDAEEHLKEVVQEGLKTIEEDLEALVYAR